jgi:hypothetical protein
MLYFNELSLHGQFNSPADFEASLRSLLALRQLASKHGLGLQTTRGVTGRPTVGAQPFREAINRLSRDMRLLIARWLDQEGPFWDESARHPGDLYLEHRGDVVTDTGLGEAAFRHLAGLQAATVRARPSDWEAPSFSVTRVEEERTDIDVPNHVDAGTLEPWLGQQEKPPASWPMLAAWARRHCERLHLADDVIAPLDGHPFEPGASLRIQELLQVLDRVARCVEQGTRLNADGVLLLQTHFAGEKSWFSDSSDGEKIDFRNELTFPHPTKSGQTIFATWHGKIKIKQLRIHYLHDFRADEPVYVVYIGPKITKR